MPPSGKTVKTPEKKEAFLRALVGGGTVSGACKAIGIARGTAYVWRAEDDEFAARWEEVYEATTDELEQTAVERAKAGDTTLLIFLLKCRRRDTYIDRMHIKQDVKVETKSELDVEIERLMEDMGRLGQSETAVEAPSTS